MSKDYTPNMHSAEHILNQTMVRFYNRGRAFSAHIEKKKSKCDYKNFTSNLTEEEITTLENAVNAVIRQNLPVTEEFIPRAAALEFLNLERLPEDAGDSIRVIRIGDYDTCPCIGQHVNNTSEIGQFKIISSSFENDILRIRFKVESTI
ncbi:MAG: hypothetical protein LWX56_07920 [Ignavibacteria bacterium]|nr:hypothetical protein [Ignavibacteria bacterium]